MDYFEFLINVILDDGEVISFGSIYDSNLIHVDAIEMFLELHPEYDMPLDFYERLLKFAEDGNILFISTSFDETRQGQLFLPNSVSLNQYHKLFDMNLESGNVFVNKNGIDLGFTNDFYAGDYYGKIKCK